MLVSWTVPRSGYSDREIVTALDDNGRDEIRRSLHAYVRWSWGMVDPVPFRDNWHIGCMCEHLEAVSAGEIPRLLINIPPGYQKSLTVSVFWPSWAWIESPWHRFMYTAYRGDLAVRDATRARDVMRNPAWQREFGDSFVMRSDQDQKTRYQNTAGGYRLSVGIPGIMGDGGDFVILDDPHNVEQAESDDVRDETVRKIRLALPTRVRSEKGGAVCIMQRLHERDYSGVALASENEDQWFHLCLPARAEHDHPFVSLPRMPPRPRPDRTEPLPGDQRIDPQIAAAVRVLREADTPEDTDRARQLCDEHDGALLFPSLFPEKRVAEIEAELGSYGAAGQLQQRPAPREGGMFKPAWFNDRYIDHNELPRDRVVVRGYDLAASTRSRSPYTAGVRMSMDARKRIYIEHVDRYRATPGGVETNMRARAENDGPGVIIDCPQDPGQAGKAQVSAIAGNLHGFVVRFSPETGDKDKRPEPLAAQAEAGNVYIVRGDWNGPFMDELKVFPASTYKDQADAASRAYARLLEFGGMVSSGASSGSY